MSICVAHVAGSVWLSRRLGVAAGLVVYAILTSLLTLLAGGLLRSVPLEKITWKNRLAGWLLPWTALVGGGQLRWLLVKNEVASIVLGMVMVASDRMNVWDAVVANHPSSPGGAPRTWADAGLSWLTLLCWLVMLGGWLWTLRTYFRNQVNSAGVLLGLRGIWIPLLIPPIAVAVSVALQQADYAWASFLVVGIPLLLVLPPVCVLLTVVGYHYLVGKPIRWN